MGAKRPDSLVYLNVYVTKSRPNGWTERAKKFCRHSRVPGGCFRLNKIEFVLKNKFSTIFFLRATPGPLASFTKIYTLREKLNEWNYLKGFSP